MDIMDLCIGGQVQDLPLQGVYLFFDFTIILPYGGQDENLTIKKTRLFVLDNR